MKVRSPSMKQFSQAVLRKKEWKDNLRPEDAKNYKELLDICGEDPRYENWLDDGSDFFNNTDWWDG